jgi:type VI secretion system secreted protein VgrG
VASSARIKFELQVGGLGDADLAVLRVDGREGLSEPYAFEVEVVRKDGEPLDLEALAGEEAELTLRRPSGEERVVHGEATRLALVDLSAGLPHYQIRIEPRLWRLGRTSRSRIFQDQTVPEIVAAVLDEHAVVQRASLSGSYPKREYVAQYRETDLAFVSRLLEAEGIWYRFEHGPGKHELVLGDSASAVADAGTQVPFRPDTGQEEENEHLFRLERTRRVATEAAARRDYDFVKPALDLTGKEGSGALEDYEYPGGQLDPGDGKRLAKLRLETLRFGAMTYDASGSSLAALPGATFEVADHLDGTMNVKLLAVRVVHRGTQGRPGTGGGSVEATYQNKLTAIEAALPYRPRRQTPMPRVAGIQTATVVGASGEEAHVDKHGRVKVLFHWDRDGARDDRSSCWVRVGQAWAGAGMGASFVPRVGQEVVVRFLEGDPDRPLVAGAVYNGQNPTPVALPGDKTRSTLRTDSSLGGGGSNELRLEDSKDAEEIWLHAQKDQNSEIENDATWRVQANEALEVAKDRQKTVLGKQSLRVGVNDGGEVGQNGTLTVAGARSTAVGVAHAEQVGAAQTVTVGGSQVVNVGAASMQSVGLAAALTVGGAYLVNVGGVLNTAVGGLKSTQVAGAAVEVVGGSRDETVGQDRAADTGGGAELEVAAGVALDTGKDVTETIDGKLELSLPEAMALLTKDGTMEADSLTIMVGGSVALVLKKSGSIVLSGGDVTIEQDGAVTLKGSQVQKDAGSSADSGSATVTELKKLDEANKVAKVTFKDTRGGGALAGLAFKATLPGESPRDGKVSGKGLIALGGAKPGQCEIEFVKLEED